MKRGTLLWKPKKHSGLTDPDRDSGEDFLAFSQLLLAGSTEDRLHLLFHIAQFRVRSDISLDCNRCALFCRVLESQTWSQTLGIDKAKVEAKSSPFGG